MDDNVRHIVLAIQDKTGEYSRHIAVVMVSIMKNTKSDICFHVFCDETLNVENKCKLEETCSRFHQKIQFHNIVLPVQENELNAIKYISMGTLYRLDIVNQLNGVNKALYLDGDIIVQMDIEQLFSINMFGNAIAAVKDKGIEKKPFLYTRNIPIKVDKYFNAGVILFDLDRIRSKYNLLVDCLKVIKQYPKDFFTDQSALNHVLQDDCCFINEKYNLFPTATNDSVDRKCIWHFAGGGKPWAVRKYQVGMLYWKYLKYTPWIEKEEDLFEMFSRTVITLEDALLIYPIGSRKVFFRNTFIRLNVEIRKLIKQFL